MPGIRLGTNPIAWSNDDLRSLGADITLEQCLCEARAAGYEGIELGHKFPRTAQALGPVLAAHGLALVSGWHSTALLERSIDDELRAMAPHLELLHALDAEVVIVAETTRAVHGDIGQPLSARPQLEHAELRLLAHDLAQLAERIAEMGLTLVYHHHMGTVVQDRDDVDCLMTNSCDALRLLLDTGHATFARIDPADLARDYAERVAHVHCKDVRRERLAAALACDSSFLDAVVDGVFTVPGDGMVDFASVLTPLAATGYEGWLVVEAEQDPAKAAPSRYARQGWQALKHAARQAGFDVPGGSE